MSKKHHEEPTHHKKHSEPHAHSAKVEEKKHSEPKGEDKKASTPGNDSADGQADEAKKGIKAAFAGKVSEDAKSSEAQPDQNLPGKYRKFPKIKGE